MNSPARLLRSAALALLVATLLSGCATAPQQAFDREQATSIKTVVIAQRPNQPDYTVDIIGHPGQSFGLVGGLIEMADAMAKMKQLTPVIDPAETRLQDRFSAALAQRLTAAGYAVQVIELRSIPSQDADLLTQVKALAKADAVVAVGMLGSYVAAGLSTPYSPNVRVLVRMLDMTSGATLYRESLNYGPAPQLQGPVLLSVDPKYRFANFEAVLANPGLARGGLLAGLDPLAQQIAQDLKPK